MIKFAGELFAKIGLKIKNEKCKCTLRGEDVTFMGATFSSNRLV